MRCPIDLKHVDGSTEQCSFRQGHDSPHSFEMATGALPGTAPPRPVLGHQEVLNRAMSLHMERNSTYNDTWRRSGWRGNLVKLRTKVERAWDVLWPADDGVHTHDVDDLLDIINYCVFIIRLVEEGDRDGDWDWPNG